MTFLLYEWHSLILKTQKDRPWGLSELVCLALQIHAGPFLQGWPSYGPSALTARTHHDTGDTQTHPRAYLTSQQAKWDTNPYGAALRNMYAGDSRSVPP